MQAAELKNYLNDYEYLSALDEIAMAQAKNGNVEDALKIMGAIADKSDDRQYPDNIWHLTSHIIMATMASRGDVDGVIKASNLMGHKMSMKAAKLAGLSQRAWLAGWVIAAQVNKGDFKAA
jgi:hypothetical protein